MGRGLARVRAEARRLPRRVLAVAEPGRGHRWSDGAKDVGLTPAGPQVTTWGREGSAWQPGLTWAQGEYGALIGGETA